MIHDNPFAKEDTPCLLCGGVIHEGEPMEEFEKGWCHATDVDFYRLDEDAE